MKDALEAAPKILFAFFLLLSPLDAVEPVENVRIVDARVAVSDSPRLAVFLDNLQAVGDISPGEATGWGKVEPRNYLASVKTSSGETLNERASIDLSAQSFNTLVIAGAGRDIKLIDVKVSREAAEKLSKSLKPDTAFVAVNLDQKVQYSFRYTEPDGVKKEILIPPLNAVQLPQLAAETAFDIEWRGPSKSLLLEMNAMPPRDLMARKTCVLLLPSGGKPSQQTGVQVIDGAGGFFITEDH